MLWLDTYFRDYVINYKNNYCMIIQIGFQRRLNKYKDARPEEAEGQGQQEGKEL